MKTYSRLILGVSWLVLINIACTQQRTETERTTTTVEADLDEPHPVKHEVKEVQVETKTTEVDKVDSCGGIASCTVDFLGDVLAFPFRLIGGLFKAIF